MKDETSAVEIEVVPTAYGETKFVVKVGGKPVRNFWTRAGAERFVAKLVKAVA